VHEYVSGLTSTPKDERFCSCKRRKFIGQNKVKICKLYSQHLRNILRNFWPKLVAGRQGYTAKKGDVGTLFPHQT